MTSISDIQLDEDEHVQDAVTSMELTEMEVELTGADKISDPLEHAKALLGKASESYERTIEELEQERDTKILAHNKQMDYYQQQISKNKHALAGIRVSLDIYKRPTEEVLNGGSPAHYTQTPRANQDVSVAARGHASTRRVQVPKSRSVEGPTRS